MRDKSAHEASDVRPPGTVRASVLAYVFFAATASGVSVSGCANRNLMTDADFPVIVGASTKSDVQPCADYASLTNYSGIPYYVRVPETGTVVRRHKGMDFCTSTGREVIAAANGTVVNVLQDNPYRGGRVTMQTNIEYQHPNFLTKSPLFLDALHITPIEGLGIGDKVKAGQVIGYTQAPGKPEIGPRSHVHFSAGPTYQTWGVHTDPNQFWQKGPGIVSCFDPRTPPSDVQVVAPIKC
jgi:murein DD-endopeptidase MepM/ murein hydrolase activator NlpD